MTADYNVRGVLRKAAAPTMQWKKDIESSTKVKLLPDMSRAIFQQDGAPAHPARKTQDWCNANFLGFWEKGTLSGNSPDLSPIENLWAIVNEELSKLSPSSSERTLFQNAQTAWSSVKGETLDNLICGMLGRIQQC